MNTNLQLAKIYKENVMKPSAYLSEYGNLWRRILIAGKKILILI